MGHMQWFHKPHLCSKASINALDNEAQVSFAGGQHSEYNYALVSRGEYISMDGSCACNSVFTLCNCSDLYHFTIKVIILDVVLNVALSVSSLSLSIKLSNLRVVMETPKFVASLLKVSVTLGILEFTAGVWSEEGLKENYTLNLKVQPNFRYRNTSISLTSTSGLPGNPLGFNFTISPFIPHQFYYFHPGLCLEALPVLALQPTFLRLSFCCSPHSFRVMLFILSQIRSSPSAQTLWWLLS